MHNNKPKGEAQVPDKGSNPAKLTASVTHSTLLTVCLVLVLAPKKGSTLGIETPTMTLA